jgi:hypothetical protein
MAEACTITEETLSTVKKISWVWVSAVGGAVGAALVNTTTNNVYSGAIERLVTVPAGAPNAPTANYDIEVLDGDSVDVLMGAGANRHETNTEQVAAANLGIVANDKLKLSITNAGDGKGGTVHLYIR